MQRRWKLSAAQRADVWNRWKAGQSLNAIGRVARVNPSLNFVVVTYPIGQLPPVGAQLFEYRNGIRAAELKVSLPQQEDNTVADIVSGTALVGDEVRDK